MQGIIRGAGSPYPIIAEKTLALFGWIVAAYSSLKMVRRRKTMSRREFLKSMGIFGGGLMFGIDVPTALGNAGKYDVPGLETLNDLNNVRTNALPTPAIGFRDAVTAKKVSEYLVPKHKQEGKKVQAALLYGAGHSGIETKLKYPFLSKATLWLYHDLLSYGSKEELNLVTELVRDEYGFASPVIRDCGLF